MVAAKEISMNSIAFFKFYFTAVAKSFGAPCHKAKEITKWLGEQNIQILGRWPGKSPGLNPIENLGQSSRGGWTNKNPQILTNAKH